MSQICLVSGLKIWFFHKQLTNSACAVTRVCNSIQITHFNQVSFSSCKLSDLHCFALFHNWKLPEQGNLVYVPQVFRRQKKRHACRKAHAHTQTCTHAPRCTSLSHVFLPPLPLCPLWMSCLLCICKTKMSERIRIIDSSPSTTVTDLADYFHAWQSLFSASLSTAIEHSAIHMLGAMSYNRAWQL